MLLLDELIQQLLRSGVVVSDYEECVLTDDLVDAGVELVELVGAVVAVIVDIGVYTACKVFFAYFLCGSLINGLDNEYGLGGRGAYGNAADIAVSVLGDECKVDAEQLADSELAVSDDCGLLLKGAAVDKPLRRILWVDADICRGLAAGCGA